MSKNKLTITISGTTGTGKTTLLEYIALRLSDLGAEVEVEDHEVLPLTEQEQISRLNYVLKNAQVKIVTKQALRSKLKTTETKE